MTRYAHIKDNAIQGVYDYPPTTWENVSNFHLLSDEQLAQYGFVKIIKAKVEYDPLTEVISDPVYSFVGDAVIEHIEISPRKEERNLESEWNDIRAERDKRIKDFEWRYSRSQREIRMGLKPSDSIETLDRYIQALADITTQVDDPREVVWPVYGE